jgi:putative FmdB family regulatory protein
MPIYEYQCRADGVFEALRAMCEAALPAACPSCGADAPRILSAPRLAQMAASEVKARDRNEKSRHEPRVVHGTQRAQTGERPALRASHSSRPWALEHG